MAYQDFTDYTEVDASSKVTVTSSKVSWANQVADETAYTYYDFGTDNFDGSFIFSFNCRMEDASTTSFYPALVSLTNSVEDLAALLGDYLGYAQYVSWRNGSQNFFIDHITSRTQHVAVGTALSFLTVYYMKFTRDNSVGTYGTLYLDVYSTSSLRDAGSAGDGDEDTISLTLTEITKFRYLYVCQSYNNGTSTFKGTGYVENLDIDAGGSTGYTKTVNGVETPAKINGIAVANIGKFNGV